MFRILILMFLVAGLALSGACGGADAPAQVPRSRAQALPSPTVPHGHREGLIRPAVPGLQDFPGLDLPDERGASLAVSAPEGVSRVRWWISDWQRPKACECQDAAGERGYCSGQDGLTPGPGETALCRTPDGVVPCTGAEGEVLRCPASVRSGRCLPGQECPSEGCLLDSPARVSVYSGERAVPMPADALTVAPRPGAGGHAYYEIELDEPLAGPAWVQIEYPRVGARGTICLRQWEALDPDVDQDARPGEAIWFDGTSTNDMSADAGGSPNADQQGSPWRGRPAIEIEPVPRNASAGAHTLRVVHVPPPLIASSDDKWLPDVWDEEAFAAAMHSALEALDLSPKAAEASYDEAELAAMGAVSRAVPEWCSTPDPSELVLPPLGVAPKTVVPFPWPAKMRDGITLPPVEAAIKALAATVPWLERSLIGLPRPGTAGSVRLPVSVLISVYGTLSDWALSEARVSESPVAKACLVGAAAGFALLQRAGQSLQKLGRVVVPDDAELGDVLRHAAALGLW